MNAYFFIVLLYIFFGIQSTALAHVRLKSIAHLSGLQENPITGYGLVIGLAGTGDSRRNKETTQAVANLLQSFGVSINPNEINSRNSATVIITANLPSYAHQGDKLDINVASLGDAKSLLGGTLLVTALKGADNQVYALAQGPISIGGYKYDLFGNIIQKNHPTAGLIPAGAVIEKTIYNHLASKEGTLHVILNRPDFTTAYQVEKTLNKRFGSNTARAKSAQDIEIHPPQTIKKEFIHFVCDLENVSITPDQLATVVVNERTGVVIAGADVKIDAVTISQGNLKSTIATTYLSPSPFFSDLNSTERIRAATSMDVKESLAKTLKLPQGTTIADLITALSKAQASTRDMIAVLESLNRAGALHAELIIQ